MLAIAGLSGAVGATLADAAGGLATSSALVRTGSASRQFTVYARDPLLSSVLCMFAERIKHGWLDRLNLRDNWRDPIVIVVRERGPTELNASTVDMETLQFDIGLSYRIRCLTPPPLDEARLRPVLVQALCAEWANRTQPISHHQPFVTAPLPLWLVEGLAQSVSERTDWLSAVAQRSVDAGHPARARDVLEMTALPANAAECGLFQANAWLFTESLLTLRDGAHTLQRFLTEMAVQKSVTGAFWTVYRDDFPQPVALERWWAVQLAYNMGIRPAQNLTATETTRQLGELLRVVVRQADGSTNVINMVEQPPEFLRRQAGQEWLQTALKDRIQRLEALRSYAHPQYRTVIDRYIEAERCWLAKKLARSRAAFEQARKELQLADQQMLEIAVVLDRAERTFAPEDFGATLRDRFRTLDQLQQSEQQRRTPIGDYLDQFDQ